VRSTLFISFPDRIGAGTAAARDEEVRPAIGPQVLQAVVVPAHVNVAFPLMIGSSRFLISSV
jgi:hypothetical protein